MNTLLSWVKAIQAERGLTFDAAFRLVMSHHTGSFGKPTKSGDAVLIAKAKELLPPSPTAPAVKTAQSAANGQGRLFLVKGADCGWAFPIFK